MDAVRVDCLGGGVWKILKKIMQHPNTRKKIMLDNLYGYIIHCVSAGKISALFIGGGDVLALTKPSNPLTPQKSNGPPLT